MRNEMGITSPLALNDNTLLGDPVDDGVADPEDTGGQFGKNVELFANFMRTLSAPPRLLPVDQKERKEVEEGFKVFKSTGCAACHVPQLVTLSEGEWVNGRTFRVPKALGNKKFHPYGDFLLHDIGTGPTHPARRDAAGVQRNDSHSGSLGDRHTAGPRRAAAPRRQRAYVWRTLFRDTRTVLPSKPINFNACARGKEPGS